MVEETDSETEEKGTKTPRPHDFCVVEVDAQGQISLFGKQPPPQLTFAALEDWMRTNVQIKDKAVIRTYIKHREILVEKAVKVETTFKPVKKSK